MNGGDER